MIAATEKRPLAGLSIIDAVAVMVGVVLGIGIFGFPPLVAQNTGSVPVYLGLWLAGGVIMFLGALCYAELGSAFPHAGGEYHYLRHAWGTRIALLFGWARGTVIQTGGIAVVAFIYGDYAQQLIPLGEHGPALHAASSVILLTAVNIAGTAQSKRLQLVLTVFDFMALVAVMAAGLMAGMSDLPSPPPPQPVEGSVLGALGMGMVFVLLTYGGWNEAAYLCGELRNPARDVSRVLILGTAIVTVCYLLTNLALLEIFGLSGLQNTHAVGAEVMRLVAGPYAADLLSLLICITALTTMNGTIMTGGRVYYALGRDIPRLRRLASWSDRGQTPVAGLATQGAITLALVLFGALSENGVETMVAYTAPVFWLFMLLIVLSVIRLRQRDPQRPRPFKIPLYPLPPIVFALTCAGLIWSSTVYAGAGALLGLAVLGAGLPVIYVLTRR